MENILLGFANVFQPMNLLICLGGLFIGVLFVAAGIVLPIVLRVKGLIPVHVPVTEETEELAAALVEETPVEITEAPAEEAAEDVSAEETPAEEEPVAEETIEEEPTPVAE